MERSRRFILSITLSVFVAITFTTCGGGGGGGGPSDATISGTVAGTTIVAVDETGSIVATDNTAGKKPDSSGNYPFSLTCPTGHQYRIYFIVAEGTSSEHVVSLYDSSDAGNVFSLSQEGTLDLGFVDTSGQNAHATNDPLDLAGVTVAGEIPIFQHTQTTLANKSFASIDDAAGEYTINTFDISNVFTETEGSLLGVTVSNGTWSFNSSGTLTIDFPPSDSITVTFIEDDPLYTDVLIFDGTAVETDRANKITPIDPSWIPATYSTSLGTISFNSDGSGSDDSESYTWFVDFLGFLNISWAGGEVDTVYQLAGSNPTGSINIIVNASDAGSLAMFPLSLTRQVPSTINFTGFDHLRLSDFGDETQRYYFIIQVKNPNGGMVLFSDAIRDVKVLEYPSMNEVPLDTEPLSAPWKLWFSAFYYDRDGTGPNLPQPLPFSELIGFLNVPVPDLLPGFYKAVVTDKSDIQHDVWFYYEAPDEVSKVQGDSMNVTANFDGSVTFSWENPVFPPMNPGEDYLVRVYVETTEDSGDGFDDSLLQVTLTKTDNSYTLSSPGVNRLKGYPGLHWYVQIRQFVLNVTNPDSTSKTYYIYRNYGPEQALNLP